MDQPTPASQTTGRRLLLARMRDPARPLAQQAVARKLHISQNSVSYWCRGLSRPESHLRKALQAWLGIPELAWLSEPEAQFLQQFEQSLVER